MFFLLVPFGNFDVGAFDLAQAFEDEKLLESYDKNQVWPTISFGLLAGFRKDVDHLLGPLAHVFVGRAKKKKKKKQRDWTTRNPKFKEEEEIEIQKVVQRNSKL